MMSIKRMMLRIIFISVILCKMSFACADADFVIQHIAIEGNQRLTSATISSYLPVHLGQHYTDAEGDAIITTLFNTGFFSDVKLSRQGDVLVVIVHERPTIGYLDITGNKEIKTKQLYPILQKLGLVEGEVFDPSKLNEIKLGLEDQYSILGHETAVVNMVVKPEPHNQVALTIQITEGPLAKVHSITFSGNQRFSQRTLRNIFQLTTPGIFTIINHHDRYSASQLQTDLTALANFYYNYGYLKFKVVSQEAIYNATHTKVDIHIVISEGPVYHVSGYRIEEHDKYARQIQPLITFKPGDVFSRAKLLAVNKNISAFFANKGYAFPQIQPIPMLDDKSHTVFVVFQVNIGRLIYVRYISITGDTRTDQRVIRTQMLQMEDALYSQASIDETKRRIQADLPYLSNLKVTTSPVAGSPSLVDLNYDVTEVNAGKASLQGGYSDIDGFIYGASFSEPNFMGTGKSVSLGFTRSDFSSNYSFSYNNPFYTIDGVSRGYNIYYNYTTPGNVGLQSYTESDVGANFSYGIPISEYDAINAGAGYDYITINNVNLSTISPSTAQFLQNNPSPYNEPNVTTGLTHQSLDRAIFPMSGNLQQISAVISPPLGSTTTLGYYTATYNGKWFFPFGDSGFVLEPHATVGYGGGIGVDGTLPFFENFYGGGIGTLPGFEPNSLGPKNPNSIDQSLGGNFETFGGINLFAPDIFNGRVRYGVLLDAGNIFETNQVSTTPAISYENFGINNFRVTAGVLISWAWPLGAPIDISLAYPLNQKSGDQPSIFGFSMGASL